MQTVEWMVIPYSVLLIEAGIGAESDIREKKVHNSWLLFCFLWNILWLIWGKDLQEILEGMLGFLIPLSLLPLFHRRWIGAGDLKLFCVLGMVMGTKIITCMILSLFACGVLGILRIFYAIYEKRYTGKETIPLVPGIFVGVFLMSLGLHV
ncbi:MAG: prepilin peptidase [Eubacteriales bacterium]|nr:prepilin peptidase [Eubacteriales bacterium]